MQPGSHGAQPVLRARKSGRNHAERRCAKPWLLQLRREAVSKNDGTLGRPANLSLMRERQQAWIRDARDVDRDWADDAARLQRLGLDTVLDVMQRAYERKYK